MPLNAPMYRLGLRMMADFGAIIAVPAVLGALAGKWFDGRYQSYPYGLIGFLSLAFVITGLTIIKKAKKYGAEYSRILATFPSKPTEKVDL